MPVKTSVRDVGTQEKVNSYNRMMCNASIPVRARLHCSACHSDDNYNISLFLQVTSQVRDGPTILRHVFSEMFSTSGLSYYNRLWIVLILILVLVYFVSPIDILPELILGPIGYIDDLGSIIVAMMYIVQLYRQDMGRRA